MNVTVPEYSLPEAYGDNSIMLLVRDPGCLFAYWELSSEQMDLIARACGCTWGEISLVLRVYDLTGINLAKHTEHSFWDHYVEALANNYYLTDVAANRAYCADLGFTPPDGRFTALIRSNVVQTPRDTMADGSGRVMTDMLNRLGQDEAAAAFAGLTFSSDGVHQFYGEPKEKMPGRGGE